MKYFLYSLGLAILSTIPSNAQPLAAYHDNQNQFFAWDNGMIRKIDYLVPFKFEIGRNAIPYLDNAKNFKIYSNGNVTKINNGQTNAFFPTDNLVAYKNNTLLYVWDKGEEIRLSTLCDDFKIGDSLVMFFDKVSSSTKIYYNNKITVLENFLSGFNTENLFSTDTGKVISSYADIASGQISAVKLSDNIAAYVNFGNYFRLFYKGEIIEQENNPVKNFGVGRNTCAYVNINNEFTAFHKGKTIPLENYEPYSYQVGDDLIAYVSNDNYFKIFYNDSVYTIGYFDPEYKVVDNIVYFQDQTGYFHIFYKGENYTLENYLPTNITANYNSVAYTTRGNMIKLFTEGQVFDVINADVPYWSLKYDVFYYKFGTNINKIFYKGKTY